LRTRPISVAALLMALVLPAAARASERDPHLAPLRRLVGKTWRGVKQGKWVEGRDMDYVEAPDARVKLRE
jgi:hypothetical protein